MSEVLGSLIPMGVVFVVCFGLTWLLARFLPTNRAWSLVDLIYYPIVAIGAIGLAATLIDTTEGKYVSKINKKFDHDMEEIGSAERIDLFERSNTELEVFSRIEQITSDIDECHEQTITTSFCNSVLKFELAVRAQTHASQIAEKNKTERILAICEQFLLTSKHELQSEQIIGAKSYLSFVEAEISQDRSFYEFEQTLNLARKFYDEEKSEWDVFFEQNQTASEVQSIIRIDLMHLRAFLFSHEFCFRLPDGIDSIIGYGEWKNKLVLETKDLEASRDQQIKLIKNQIFWASQVQKIRNDYWIYVILLALSLKFGKGTAHWITSSPKRKL